MFLSQIFSEVTTVNLNSTEKDDVFVELVNVIHSVYPELDCDEAVTELNNREKLMSTGIMHSVGIPHAEVESMKGVKGAIGICSSGIDYNSLDKSPVHVVFMILSGKNLAEEHILILKKLALVLQTPDFIKKVLECSSSAEVYKLFSTIESEVAM